MALTLYILSNAALCVQWFFYSLRSAHSDNSLIILSNFFGIVGMAYVLYSLLLTNIPFKKRTLVIVTIISAILGMTHGLFINQPENIRIALYSFFLAGIVITGATFLIANHRSSKLFLISAITASTIAISLIIRGVFAFQYNPEIKMNQSHWINTIPSILYFLFYYFEAIVILLIIKQQNSKTIEQDNKELQQVNTTKNKIISVMAHDLRNHFNAILGFSNLLKDDDFDLSSSEGKHYINILNEQTEDTNGLLESLLTWSRSQSNQISFLPEELDLNELVSETVDGLRNIANLKNISINFSILGSNQIYADKNMLNTTLRNLITNSIKFTPSQGKIDITILERLDNFEFSIKDNGIGLKEENIKKLFNKDENTSTLGTNNEKGTGLGLLLCREFVEKHDGKIWVNSKPGKGSEFIFTIPKK